MVALAFAFTIATQATDFSKPLGPLTSIYLLVDRDNGAHPGMSASDMDELDTEIQLKLREARIKLSDRDAFRNDKKCGLLAVNLSTVYDPATKTYGGALQIEVQTLVTHPLDATQTVTAVLWHVNVPLVAGYLGVPGPANRATRPIVTDFANDWLKAHDSNSVAAVRRPPHGTLPISLDRPGQSNVVGRCPMQCRK